MTEKMSRTSEVHLVAAIGKDCDYQSQRHPKPGPDQGDGPPKRPTGAFAHKDAQQSVACSTQNEAPLVADARQQQEACKHRAECRPRRIKDSSDSSAVHPVFHAGLNTRGDG